MRTFASAPDVYRYPPRPFDDVEPLNFDTYEQVYGGLVEGENTGVFLIYGQSNAANAVPNPTYTVTQAKNHMLNPFNGAVYKTKTPMLGASFFGGNWVARLGDLLISAGTFDRVIVCNVAAGGLTSTQLARGGDCNYRPVVGARRLLALGLQPTFVLRHQGESDVWGNFSSTQVRDNIRSEVETLREVGITCPVMVANVAYVNTGSVGTPAYNAVRAGQQAAVSEELGIILGPDTDTVGSSGRGTWDLHFNENGAPTVANLFKTAIIDAL